MNVGTSNRANINSARTFINNESFSSRVSNLKEGSLELEDRKNFLERSKTAIFNVPGVVVRNKKSFYRIFLDHCSLLPGSFYEEDFSYSHRGISFSYKNGNIKVENGNEWQSDIQPCYNGTNSNESINCVKRNMTHEVSDGEESSASDIVDPRKRRKVSEEKKGPKLHCSRNWEYAESDCSDDEQRRNEIFDKIKKQFPGDRDVKKQMDKEKEAYLKDRSYEQAVQLLESINNATGRENKLEVLGLF